MPFDLQALEDVVLETPAGIAPEFAPVTVGEVIEDQPPAPDLELISEATFIDKWNFLHDLAGGMVQMRTSAPCPLGDQARSEGGRIAGTACYELIKSQPALARLILSTESTYIGQVIAIATHGFSCVQVIKASVVGREIEAPDSAQEPVFRTQREAT